MLRRKHAVSLAMAATLAAGIWIQKEHVVRADTSDLPNTGMADAATFLSLYNKWRTAYTNGPDANSMTVQLVPFGSLSSEPVDASGSVKINLLRGAVSSRVSGLPEGEWELWLIDNSTGNNSTLPDSQDTMFRVGRYTSDAGDRVLTAQMEARPGFEIDRAAVVRAGQNPASGFVLLGSANIYERLYRGMVRVEQPVGVLRPAEGESDIWQLAAKGRQLFNKETFQGNGRACATCHSESNNFTLDSEFIATLPASDPLFVYERNSDLKVNFEHPEMLRKLGLITANADGMDDLAHKYVLRPPRSLQAIGTQIQAPEAIYFADFTATGAAAHLPERLGWGNDNLPLREFAIGAIIQHMPRTLNRKSGVDYRLPNDEELDAMAIYQLSIGRQEDFDLKTLKLSVREAVQGQKLFMDTGAIGEPGHKNCNACHFNAGGTAAVSFNGDAPNFSPILDQNVHGFNAASGTNVNGFPASLALNIPRDGGYGTILLPTHGFGNIGDLGDGNPFPVEEFKSMSLVESADTGPYFHNHAVATLEEAVAFYGSDAYKSPDSIGDKIAGPVPIDLKPDANDPEVRAIATFLRVLNAIENIRSSISAVERARRAPSAADAVELALLAREDVKDAQEVLSKGSLSSAEFSVVLCRARLTAARTALENLRGSTNRAAMEPGLVDVLNSLRLARLLLVDQKTLPASFQR